jgi:hypothetical protein
MKNITISKDYDNTWSFSVSTGLGINNCYTGYRSPGEALDDALTFYPAAHLSTDIYTSDEMSDVTHTATS